jgi:hypothetical protein
VPTCEGWLLKGGQWRFFRLENEQLMWFDRQHTRRLRGKALVSLCSVFSATDDVLSFVVERDSSWSRTMHATSVDDSTTWQSYLVDVVRAAAERSVSLYARTAKARGDVQQRAGWAVLHGQKVWLLLRGGLMVWFATPAPSSRARGCLRLARAGLASLPRNAETVAKSGVLNVRTAGGRRLEFHVAEHFSEWHHDIVFAIQLANDVAPREAQLARQPSAIQRTHRSILHRLQFATGSLSSSVAPQSANSTRSTASGRAGTVGSGSPAATIAANANNSPPGSGQLTRKARMQSDRRTVVLEQHINHGLFPGSKVTAPSTGTASPPPVDSENEPVRDVYGFVVPQAHIDVYDAFLQKFVGSLREKTQLCQALIETPEACGDLDLASLVHRRGIAPRYRGAFWQAFVGADVRVASDPERYEKLARAAAAAADSFATAAPAPLSPRAAMASATYQIELDIGRTFPGLSEDVAFRDSLRAVLYAYAAHNPSVGYTQSMNMLAGIFLVFMPPASAFWMLEYVVTTLMPFTFNDQLVGCFADADVLVLLAERELPQLVRHCNEIDLQFSMFATQWFMCLFVLSFPSETAFRIWDRVLYSGPGAIFDVALRALRCAEKKILATTDAFDAMAALNATTSAMYDADVLFATKLKHEIDHGWVKLLRNKFRKLRLLS